MHRPFLLLLALAACDDQGSFEIVDPASDPSTDVPGTDPGTGPDTPDPTDTDRRPDRPGDTEDPPGDTDAVTPLEPNPCGPYAPPEPGEFDTDVRAFAGVAELDSRNIFARTWTGCEVERHFNADGSLDCEVVRRVEGVPGDNVRNGPQLVYDVTLTVDEQATSCRAATRLTLRFGLDIEFDGSVTYYRAPAQGGSFAQIGSYPIQGNLAQFSFEYLTPLGR